MRISADALPLPYAVGGSNEGIGSFADGLVTDPSPETHKIDLSAPDGYVSSWEKLRRFTRSRALRVVAAAALATTGAACANQDQGGGPQVAAESSPAPAEGHGVAAVTPECYGTFANLNAAEQQDCRALIAGMGLKEVNQLQGLDEARWASYYRHVALGEQGVLFNTLRSNIINDQDGAKSAALHFLTGYQGNIYRLAWLLHNKPAVGGDPRTRRALLGTDATDTESYKLAASLASHNELGDYTADEYVQATSATSSLFTSLFAENVRTRAEGDTRILQFTAETTTVSGTPRQQMFTYRFYRYVEAHKTENGETIERADDPNSPDAPILQQLGAPLIAGLPKISDVTN